MLIIGKRDRTRKSAKGHVLIGDVDHILTKSHSAQGCFRSTARTCIYGQFSVLPPLILWPRARDGLLRKR